MTTLILSALFGGAPFCLYDGYNYQCYYYSWSQCEQAVKINPNARCVVRP